MSIAVPEVDLSGIRDPQKPLALAVGIVLVVVGIAGLSGVVDMDVLGPGLVFGLFGIPFWLGVTAIVAGGLGVVFAGHAGGATTFNKVAAGLVLPPVFFLAVTDWALATGGVGPLVVGVVTLLLAVVFVVVGVVLLRGHPLAFVFPVIALLAILDWALSITALIPSDPVTLPTVGLLALLAVVVGLVGFEGGKRMTGQVL